jgi:predicted O-methyltransferase YrrM
MESKEPRPVRIEWRPGITLTEYAAKWVDMAPHIDALMDYAQHRAVIVEFGVRGGVSTWAMLKALQEGGRIIAVDNDPDVLEMLPPWVRDDPRLTLIIGDDLSVDIPVKSADLVVIDSGHEYEQTMAELELAASLKPKRILLHDYLYADTPGVREAVDEFTERGRWRLVSVHPSQWGLAVLGPNRLGK